MTFFNVPYGSQGNNGGFLVVQVFSGSGTPIDTHVIDANYGPGFAPVSNGGYRDFSGSYTISNPVQFICDSVAADGYTLPAGQIKYRYGLQATGRLMTNGSTIINYPYTKYGDYFYFTNVQ